MMLWPFVAGVGVGALLMVVFAFVLTIADAWRL